ncbi:hypothetical protein ACVWXO_003015 [Bradyrhizobium sp. LM2.7]
MRCCLMIGLALATLCGASTFAEARPPTVMNSPGYDARLQESRKALGASSTTAAPANPTVPASKRSKKKHPN